MTTTIRTPNCEACGTPVSPSEMLLARADNYPIHMACVRKRHQAMTKGKCVCRTRKYAKRCQNGSRVWLSCTRCLGQIEQLS